MRTDRNRRYPRLAALLILLVLPIFIGSPFCSEDKGVNPDPIVPPSRTTPRELLTNWFEKAYSNQDSVLYEEMLDDEFSFQFTTEDAESLDIVDGFWAKTSDLNSTGRMFRSDNVGDITIDFPYDASQDVEYNGDDCDNCREVTITGLVLNVQTNPQAVDPLILQVRSRQVFVVKKDPADATKWVIFRQVEFDTPTGG